jgi:dolichol-phosphate mannosyltransferase
METTEPAFSGESLQSLYGKRFNEEGRLRKQKVWEVVVREVFQRWVAPDAAVLDIGCGFGEFLNHVRCGRRVGVDMNPESSALLHPDVEFHRRPVDDLGFLAADQFDVVFVSNFLEHIENKPSVERLLRGILRVLKPSGQCIIMGPNIRFLPGLYWDYWDHHVAITDRSLTEVLELVGYRVEQCWPRFLPYTLRSALPSWPILVWLYVKMPWVWPIFGRQFLARAIRPRGGESTK